MVRPGWNEAMAMERTKPCSAAEGVAIRIEDLILEGSLRPGDLLLPERELALPLNVSRPTVRQGIKMVEDKGLIVSDAGGARRVAALATSISDPLIELLSTHGDAVDHYLELRATLEGMGARLAAARANEVDRAKLAKCMERIDRAHAEDDPRAEAEADLDLHIGVYEASHNVVLLHIMRALSGMLRKGVFHNREKLYARSEIRDVLRDQHRAIYAGIMARDAVAAGTAAEDHMLYTRRVLSEIAAADARLEISLRRLHGGELVTRQTGRSEPRSTNEPSR
jgi:GntR family transcriptional repressor for pyruvate dehydrogenase complex